VAYKAPTLSFLGAAENVTGSRFLLEIDGFKILVDSGIYQERDLVDRNWDPFPVAPGSIDVILLTHAHLDHCGYLPKLVKEGFSGRIYCTEATADIAQIVLMDCAHIMKEDAEYKIKRHKRQGRKSPRPVLPLYAAEDVQRTIPLFATVKYKQQVKLSDGIEASFHDAGHILGASMIKLKANFNGQSRTILFSGDIGRRNRPILQDPTLFDEADYCIVESTYGDRIHDTFGDTQKKLAGAINLAHRDGGNIVVPSFAIERSQEVLYYMNELLLEDKIPTMPVFLDSPMAISVTEVFKKHPELFDKEMIEHLNNHESPFNFPGLKMSRATKESKAINDIESTVMVIAGSGMCTGGRVKHHLINNISRPESMVIFVGYQAAGTLGREILERPDEVRILGQTVAVRAKIVRINGFSAHADRDEIFHWLSALNKAPRHVFVVHGEKRAAHSFRDFVEEKTNWNISVPKYNDKVVLD